jgi:hypothetical protein
MTVAIMLDLFLKEAPMLYSASFTQLLIYFVINSASVLLLTRVLHYQKNKKKDYVFTYLGISNTIFLLCFLLSNIEMQLGLALGLFAIFGIIRYRTSQVSIKEMTYLFMVIGISVINAVANNKISIAELAFANVVLVGSVWLKERVFLLNREVYKLIQYDQLDNIRPENHIKLKEDLESRLGMTINRIEIGKVNLLRDSVLIRVYFNERDDSFVGNYVVNGTDNDPDDD